MAARPNVKPLDVEATFTEEGLDARALITRTDKKGIITFASKAYRDMTKYSKEELIGKPHSIVRHPTMPEAAFKEMWDTILRGEHWEGMVKNLRKDGKYYWVIVQIDPINEEGEITYDKPEEIAGFVAVRREPSREEVAYADNLYKKMRKAELLAKSNLKDWEKEVLKSL
ncbi:PAS domain S-box protein [Caminibacter mediatlanticus TB-2]|uniref:PAS domain S-box protein n=1 Tax=Caminibacter mediatlanticus TB-2 TaxID=391592 RepID=A0ABX5VDQ9_9BACT|nr:PAS domain-containing protein [Caminibacter mediatlanticus]QCT94991.1 PAS domain S-box protein [Caminibacter mediatlanticus TB-2]